MYAKQKQFVDCENVIPDGTHKHTRTRTHTRTHTDAHTHTGKRMEEEIAITIQYFASRKQLQLNLDGANEKAI